MLPSTRLVAALLISTAVLAGCSNGQDRSAATRQAAAAVPADAGAATQRLDQVLTDLTLLQGAEGAADLKKRYGDLRDHAQGLDSALADVQASSDQATATGRTQIAQWQQQASAFADGDLRKASMKRQDALRDAVDALAVASARLSVASTSFHSAQAQVLGALDLDLSRPGVQSLTPSIDKLAADAPALRQAVALVAERGAAVNAAVNR